MPFKQLNEYLKASMQDSKLVSDKTKKTQPVEMRQDPSDETISQNSSDEEEIRIVDDDEVTVIDLDGILDAELDWDLATLSAVTEDSDWDPTDGYVADDDDLRDPEQSTGSLSEACES